MFENLQGSNIHEVMTHCFIVFFCTIICRLPLTMPLVIRMFYFISIK